MENLIQIGGKLAIAVAILVSTNASAAGPLRKIRQAVKNSTPHSSEWFRNGNFGRSAQKVREDLLSLMSRTESNKYLQDGDTLVVKDPESNAVFGMKKNDNGDMRAWSMDPPKKDLDSESLDIEIAGSDQVNYVERFETINGPTDVRTIANPILLRTGEYRQTLQLWIDSPNMDKLSHRRIVAFNGLDTPNPKIRFINKDYNEFEFDLTEVDGLPPGRPLHMEAITHGKRIRLTTLDELEDGTAVFHRTDLRIDLDSPNLTDSQRIEYRGHEKLTKKQIREMGLLAEITDYAPRASGRRSGGMRRATADTTETVGEAR